MSQVTYLLETAQAEDKRPDDRSSWYRLDVIGAGAKADIQLDQSADAAAILPLVGPHTSYLMRFPHPPKSIRLVAEPSGDVEFSPTIRSASAKDFAQLGASALIRRGLWKIKFPGGSAYFLAGSGELPRAELAALLRSYRDRNRHQRLVRQFEIGDAEAAELFPEIDRDWPCLAPGGRLARAGRKDAPADIAIYIHLFFADQWPDFCHRLGQVEIQFDLHVSAPCHRPDLEAEIRRLFPQAVFHLCDNRGRDIWPFVRLLQSGTFDRYVAVCKLHTKKSDHLYCGEDHPDFGKRWRRSALLELIGTSERVNRIAGRFRSDPRVGIIGPSNLWINEPIDSDEWGAKKNRGHMLALAARLRLSETSIRSSFFAGTMFWFRPSALKGIAAGNFSPSDFEPEPLANEAALPHSFERVFNLVGEAAGFEILGSRDV